MRRTKKKEDKESIHDESDSRVRDVGSYSKMNIGKVGRDVNIIQKGSVTNKTEQLYEINPKGRLEDILLGLGRFLLKYVDLRNLRITTGIIFVISFSPIGYDVYRVSNGASDLLLGSQSGFFVLLLTILGMAINGGLLGFSFLRTCSKCENYFTMQTVRRLVSKTYRVRGTGYHKEQYTRKCVNCGYKKDIEEVVEESDE